MRIRSSRYIISSSTWWVHGNTGQNEILYHRKNEEERMEEGNNGRREGEKERRDEGREEEGENTLCPCLPVFIGLDLSEDQGNKFHCLRKPICYVLL